VSSYGGPSAIKVEEFNMATMQLNATDVLVRNSYAGVNFIDTYHRSGMYPRPLPFVIGREGSGAIVQVGSAIERNRLGQRVAYLEAEGSYSSFAIVKHTSAFAVPDGVDDRQAAAVLLQGCTAHYLARSCYPVRSGDTVLVHAAAGGTGLILTQVCKLLGATVIGTCGGDAKVQAAKTIGRADHVIDYSAVEDWPAEVRRVAPEGVNVVFDGVGKATFLKSLTVLKPRGHMITFGNASGAVDPVAPLLLTKYGSIVLQRPSLQHFSAPGEIDERVKDVFDWIVSGKVVLANPTIFPLGSARQAHEQIEGRMSLGKILLDCQE
jgi:NADPH2:quinone reductase